MVAPRDRSKSVGVAQRTLRNVRQCSRGCPVPYFKSNRRSNRRQCGMSFTVLMSFGRVGRIGFSVGPVLQYIRLRKTRGIFNYWLPANLVINMRGAASQLDINVQD